MVTIAWLGIIVGVVLIASSVARKSKEARQREYAELAERHGFAMVAPEPPGCLTMGFDFAPRPVLGDHLGLVSQLEGFHPFGEGSGKAITLIAHGEKPSGHWHIFDYHYTTGSGKSEETHHISAVVARVMLVLPNMSLREQGFFDNIGSAMGFRDIQFESDDFNRRYYVKCTDERRCYDIVHPQMIEYLLSIPPRHFQMGGLFFVCVLGGRPTAMELERAMLDMEGVLDRIPAYVRQDIGFSPPSPAPGERGLGGEGSRA